MSGLTPTEAEDRLYLDLKGARERLCRAQHHVPPHRPGDRMTLSSPSGDLSSTFVQQCQHPIWPALQLVIWKMDDGTWSHDALDPRLELPGDIDMPSSVDERRRRLRGALLGADRA